MILDSLHVTISHGSFATIHYLLRKLAHPAEYAIFAMLMYGSSSEPHPYAWRPRRALWCFLIAAAYSLTDEFHQRFVPGRTPALADCGIDSLGGALGMFVYYLDNLVSQSSKTPSAPGPPDKTKIVRWLPTKPGLAIRRAGQ
jgi:VanZ family protein